MCGSQSVGNGETVVVWVVVGLLEEKTVVPGEVWVEGAGAVRMVREVGSKGAGSRGEHLGGEAQRGAQGTEVKVGGDR